MNIDNIIRSYDLIVSLILTMLILAFVKSDLPILFVKSAYSTGITVLSIVFSLFFASLAVIMSSGDSDFIKFLEEKNQFTGLINTFKYTLIILFFGLVVSLIFYLISEYQFTGQNVKYQNRWMFISFCFFFLYALACTVMSVKDTILFSLYRSKFILFMKDKETKNEEDSSDPS